MIIDADTHIDENEETWECLTAAEREFMPRLEEVDGRPFWLIDGRRIMRIVRDDQETGTTRDTRELRDVGERLHDMDSLGVDVQVIYPTLFITEVAADPAWDLALRRAYNRWLAERCAASAGRLRWIMLPALKSPDQCLADLRWAKDHGAVGILKKGDRENGYWPADSHFFPFYEEAERLGLAICFHVGTGDVDFDFAKFPLSVMHSIVLPVAHAFHSLIANEIPKRFPRLRFGFVEATASWVPIMMYDLERRLKKHIRLGPGHREANAFELSNDLSTAYRMFVTCQVDEDLPYILRYTGEGALMIGSDYSHADQAKERQFVDLLRQRAAGGDLPPTSVERMLSANPAALYGL